MSTWKTANVNVGDVLFCFAEIRQYIENVCNCKVIKYSESLTKYVPLSKSTAFVGSF